MNADEHGKLGQDVRPGTLSAIVRQTGIEELKQ
jgi:predicted RNA binding protein YcfA (HicA-like mRNA interferase family)